MSFTLKQRYPDITNQELHWLSLCLKGHLGAHGVAMLRKVTIQGERWPVNQYPDEIEVFADEVMKGFREIRNEKITEWEKSDWMKSWAEFQVDYPHHKGWGYGTPYYGFYDTRGYETPLKLTQKHMETKPMASEPRGKWTDPPQGYKLKSDVGALCSAIVKEFEGKKFGEFYVTFSKDMAKRAEQYGDKLFMSPKQEAILAKVEVNVFPDGVKATPKTASDWKPEVYSEKDLTEIPF